MAIIMDELSSTKAKLNAARANHERDYEVEISKLNERETKLTKRLDRLNQMKHKAAEENGNIDATDDDIVEINAGGKVIAAKRLTLTQLDGSRLEAICSGRWDKQLLRDSNGRIFLDVNSGCFQAIVDYLNEMMISPEDNPPKLPSADDDDKHILNCQLDLLGIVPKVELPESMIVKDPKHATQLLNWLKEDDSDGELSLLYRSSRDGHSNTNTVFHSKCDNKGCTLTVIETACGRIFGGYSNTPWKGGSGGTSGANKAFLFSLGGDSPCKMKLKDPNNNNAVFHYSSYGPTFGNCDLNVHGKTVTTHFGRSYESGSGSLPRELRSLASFAIKEMEVFQVGTLHGEEGSGEPKRKKARKAPEIELISQFSEDINKAINERWACLLQAESELSDLEDSFKDEQTFIDKFAGVDNDVVTLNVSGTIMMTKRSTLCIAVDSVLAQQFDDNKWTEQGYNTPRVKEWTVNDVTSWFRKVDGIPNEVADTFAKNEITGRELLALNMEGLKMIGIERAGTLCLLLKEIKKLEEASQDVSTLIEHGPYCFGKILDHLRLKHLHSEGVIGEPTLPMVCDSQKDRFEKVVKYYFPGVTSKFILG